MTTKDSMTKTSAGARPFLVLMLGTLLLTTACDDGDTPTAPTDPVTILTTTLVEGIEGQGYTQQLSAEGGSGGYSWTLAAGSLPAGITLTPAGAISGTPIAPGTASFRVRATDGDGQAATADLTIGIVQALAIHTLTIAAATVDLPYTAQLQSVGGRGAYTWAITGGDAATWLTISAGGRLSGTPTVAGTSSVVVSLSDASGQLFTREFALTVLGPMAVADVVLPRAVEGRAYATQLVATGGDGAYTWSIVDGTLPAGLALGTNGALIGTPTVAGEFSFTVEAMDGAGRNATRDLTLTVERAPTIQTQSVPPADLGVAYSTQLVATGGTGSYSWTVTTGQLPTGLTLSAAGVISGTSTTEGSFSFTVQVSDEANVTHTRAFTMVVADIQNLTSGVAVTGIDGGASSTRYYAIQVPAGATSLTVAMSGGTGDADLYVRRGQLPLEFTYDCRPLRQGNQETCTFTAPQAGAWYVMVRGFTAYAGVELVATIQQ